MNEYKITIEGLTIFLKIVRGREIEEWISQRHYLKSCGAGRTLRMSFEVEKKVEDKIIRERVGAMMWGPPIARKINQYEILELSRMYFIDDAPKNTESCTLSLARRWIYENHDIIRFVIAYSDPSVGHHGTIYKADNWVIWTDIEGGQSSNWHRRKDGRATKIPKNTTKKCCWIRNIN